MKLLFISVIIGMMSYVSSGDVVRFDFESGDLQGWEIVEGRFDYFVSDRPEFHNRYPGIDSRYNKQGTYYLSTVEQQPGMPSNDGMTGVAESPVFVLAGPVMTFLAGGGSSEETYVALYTLDGEEVAKVHGRNTEVLSRVEWNLPQVVGKAVFLRMVDRNSGGWGYIAFDDFVADGRLDEKLTRQRAVVRKRLVLEKMRSELADTFGPVRAAVDDLVETYGEGYPGGKQFQGRLEAIEVRLEDAALDELEIIKERFEGLRREALIANPLVSGQEILFVMRKQYRSHYHAIDTLFHTGEFNVDRNEPHWKLFEPGGAMKTIDFGAGGAVRTLVEVPAGIARDPQIHFDGRKIVFAMRRNVEEDYHIWEINTDGTNLRKLTSAEGVCDFDPIYLADDSIVFSSTREPKYNMCSRDSAANLFRMDGDGANIYQITKNTLFDNHSTAMSDGRILYARWEYVDRNFGDAHGLWTVNPDGTNQAVYWGNNTAVPGAVFNAQEIPGTEQILCVLGPHHDRLWGAMAIIDRRLGLDGRKPVVRTWPADAIDPIRSGGAFDCDLHARTVKLKYEDPWPLSDKYFLCSRMTGKGEQTGIYLVDVFGNEILLHTEATGCYDPMPVKGVRLPPAIASRRDFESESGYFFVGDVYEGTHMLGVSRGSVKYLRVVESPEKRHWSKGLWHGQGYTAPAMNWHSLENKRILGTVPVEEDGSAYFEVPADVFVYFQLLDEDGMMIQSMRSGTVAQPGEHTGCVGCHDQRHKPPLVTGAKTPKALMRAPSKLQGWYGAARLFGFMAEVQPVFDKHCVSCHDYGKKAGENLNLAADRTLVFNTAYMELWRKGYVKCVGAGPAPIQGALSWGSHASKLIAELQKPSVAEHDQIRLSREEFDRLVTWLDLNAVYYPTYACAYPGSRTGRTPLDGGQFGRLSELTGVDLNGMMSFGGNQGPQVSFDRPEFSRCLAGLADKNSAKYKEALDIIRAGKERLEKYRRADMAGFEPCEVDRKREAKYAMRQRIEQRNRQAIRDGRKAYDE